MSTSAPFHSNAFNFTSHLTHGVDPRTGLYTVSLALPGLKGNRLAGPALPLRLSFSPMSTADLGLGLGWSLNLSEYVPQTGRLSVGDGETYTVTGSGSQPHIPEKKLDAFHFHDDGNGRYRVAHKAGHVEVLQLLDGTGMRAARPVQWLQDDGRCLWLDYVTFRGAQRLHSVRDEHGELLRLVRDNDERVELQYFPGRGENNQPLWTWVLDLDANGWVRRIMLPTPEPAGWRIDYERIDGTLSMTGLWTPTGARETLEYAETGRADFPANALAPLPRVTRHRVDPSPTGGDHPQPIMEVRYSYTRENFLGFGALDSWSEERGMDHLYEVADAGFRYGSTAALWLGQRAHRTVQRLFNRFHLQTDEVTTQGTHRQSVSTTYYADLDPHLPFEQQPAQCQLPYQVETRWTLTDNEQALRVDVEQTRYDMYGNLIERVRADGTTELQLWYPSDGDGLLCPSDPERFVRQLRSVTLVPAVSAHGSAPTLRTDYAYREIPAVPGQHSLRFLRERQRCQVLTGEHEQTLSTTSTTWHDDPGDLLRLGRASRIDEALDAPVNSTTYDYGHVVTSNADLGRLEVIETTTAFDGTQQQVIQQHACHTGTLMYERDVEGLETEYTYDALARLTCESVAAGTVYAAVCRHAYHLLDADTDPDPQAWQRTTDVRQVDTVTRVDGMGRRVQVQVQDVDAPIAPEQRPAEPPLRTTWRARFNGLGQCVEETAIEWLGPTNLALTTRYGYDDWGQCDRVTAPDGTHRVSQRSPFGVQGPVETHWHESNAMPPARSQLDVLHYNRFGSVERREHCDADGNVLFTTHASYDGLGRCLQTRELWPDNERLTCYTYDVWDRCTQVTLPDGTQVQQRYCAHSRDGLPVELKVVPANESEPCMVVGTQTFDGLERLCERTVGGRVERFLYQGGSEQLHQRITPDGHTLTYRYAQGLSHAPTSMETGEDVFNFGYDPASATLTDAGNASGKRLYEHTPSGVLAAMQWTGREGGALRSEYTWSRLGRLLDRSDGPPGASAQRLQGHAQYDGAGRLFQYSQGDVSCALTYDAFGRTHTVTTHDHARQQSVSCTLGYDARGREVMRSFNAGDHRLELIRHWYANDQLQQRTVLRDDVLLLQETFRHDLQNRLRSHTCSGPALPQDPYGHAIVSQTFVHDAVDNIRLCISQFDDSTTDTATSHFSTADPCQLDYIVHRHADYPALQKMEYDSNGNLLHAAGAHTFRYDRLSRLTELGDAESTRTLARFMFDGHSELTAVVEADSTQTLRGYDGDRLHHELGAGRLTHYLRVDDSPLAVQDHGANARTILLLSDALGSVVGQVDAAALDTAQYSAYGFSEASATFPLGYNGERREPGGLYLLGRGYRAYHPALMRFGSPDSESPFGAGGVNPYAYCSGNPVDFNDPSGHYSSAPDYNFGPPSAKAGNGFDDAIIRWLGVATSVLLLGFSLTQVRWSRNFGNSAQVAGLLGAGIQAAGIGLQTHGALTRDNVTSYLGGSFIALGATVGLGAPQLGRLLKRRQQAPTQAPAMRPIDDPDIIFKAGPIRLPPRPTQPINVLSGPPPVIRATRAIQADLDPSPQGGPSPQNQLPPQVSRQAPPPKKIVPPSPAREFRMRKGIQGEMPDREPTPLEEHFKKLLQKEGFQKLQGFKPIFE